MYLRHPQALALGFYVNFGVFQASMSNGIVYNVYLMTIVAVGKEAIAKTVQPFLIMDYLQTEKFDIMVNIRLWDVEVMTLRRVLCVAYIVATPHLLTTCLLL